MSWFKSRRERKLAKLHEKKRSIQGMMDSIMTWTKLCGGVSISDRQKFTTLKGDLEAIKARIEYLEKDIDRIIAKELGVKYEKE